jgi:hypothetical protein
MILSEEPFFLQKTVRVPGTPCFLSYTPLGAHRLYWAKRLSKWQKDMQLEHICKQTEVAGVRLQEVHYRRGDLFIIECSRWNGSVITQESVPGICNHIQKAMRVEEAKLLVELSNKILADPNMGLREYYKSFDD